MSNYIDNFQSHSVASGLPTGWASLWNTGTWEIIDESGDKILSKLSQTTLRRGATLDAIDADADRDDVEVLVKFRISAFPSGGISGVVVRATGTSTATANGYACMPSNVNDLVLNKYVTGTGTTFLTNTNVGFNWANNTWYWMRFRVVADSLKAKVWPHGDAEPGAWNIETTDSSVTGVGKAGVLQFTGGVVSGFAEIAIATNGDTATLTVDTTAPVLTSPTGTTASATTATGTVTTDEGNGTLFFLATTNATESASTVIAGGATGGSQAITSTGVKNVNFASLTPATGYYAHYVHRDAALNVSTLVSSSLFTTSSADVTAPTLSAPSGTQTGATTASLSVTTNENNGVLYTVVTTSATPPTTTQIRAGQNNAGTAAVYASNQTITSTGAKTFAATGLTASTTYYAYFHQRDASNNDSTVSAASSFTTAASGTKGVRVSMYNGATARASLTGLSALWWDATTPHTFGAPTYATNTATTDSSGQLQLNLSGSTSLAIGGSGFLLVFKLDGADPEDSLEFGGIRTVVDIA